MSLGRIVNAVAAACMLTLLSGAADASQALKPLRLPDMVKRSTHIFAGTVRSTEAGPSEDGRTIVTRVTFERLRFAKGERRAPTIVLTMYGGKYKGTERSYVGEPSFIAGNRYIVMANRSLGTREDLYAPVVGHEKGVLRVVSAGTPGAGELHDYRGRPVVRITEDYFEVLRRPDSRRRTRTGASETIEGKTLPPYVEVARDDGIRVDENEVLRVLGLRSRSSGSAR